MTIYRNKDDKQLYYLYRVHKRQFTGGSFLERENFLTKERKTITMKELWEKYVPVAHV